jgi:hypothetical protein
MAKPDLSHLRAFGSLVTAQRPGPRKAKLDRHTYDGIFIGYKGSTKNISYLDIHSGRVKNGNSYVFDEAHYTSTNRPPGPQFLFNLGLTSVIPSHNTAAPTTPTMAYAPMPPMPKTALTPIPLLACTMPLPLGELTTHKHLQHLPTTARLDDELPPSVAAAAALTAPEVMSIEFSGDPFGPSFVESIPITSTHASAGLHFKLDPARDRLRLLAIEPGTPAARINRWRSRLRFAYILSINDIDIRTQTDIDQALATLRAAGTSVCDIRLTFDEIRNSLSASGLPQLYFDQLRDVRKILRSLRETPEPAIAHHLTRSGLKKQPDWSEWQSSEFLHLDNKACLVHPALLFRVTPFSTGSGSTRSKKRRMTSKRLVPSATAPHVVVKHRFKIKPTHPLRRWQIFAFSLPSLLSKASLFSAPTSQMLSLKLMRQHNPTAYESMSNSVNGGPTKAVPQFLQDMSSPFSRISKDILKLLDNGPNI